MDNEKIVRMGYAIQVYLKTEHVSNARPADLMPFLIKRGYFKQDYERTGLPLRNILRSLDEQNLLYLLPQVTVQRSKNRQWFFNAISE